jgi:hypothetical protein
MINNGKITHEKTHESEAKKLISIIIIISGLRAQR